jgi:hypothetical protein
MTRGRTTTWLLSLRSGLWPTLVVTILISPFAAGELLAQRPQAQPSGHLWMSDSPLDDGRRLLIVIDPATRHAAVYHVDAASGSITLKSSRDISWDLTLGEFNAQDPKPTALKKLLESGGHP